MSFIFGLTFFIVAVIVILPVLFYAPVPTLLLLGGLVLFSLMLAILGLALENKLK